MTCDAIQRAIDERLPAHAADLPNELAAHLAGCPVCRAHLTATLTIGRYVANCRAHAAALPDDALADARRRLLAAAIRVPLPAPRRRLRIPNPFATVDPLLAWGVGLAVLVFVAFIGVVAWPRAPREPPASVVAVQPERATEPRTLTPEPVPTKLATKIEEPQNQTPSPEPVLTKAEEPELTGLPAFRAEYEELKASVKGVSLSFLQRFACYLEGPSRTLDERFDGWKLLSEACEEAGERKMAVDTFGRHLDAYEERRVARMALKKAWPIGSLPASYALNKVTRTFYGDKDKIGALAYGDLILSRYPDSPEVDRVQMLIGDYYESMRNYDAGIRQMQAIMELRPDTPLARQAKENMARMLYNARRKDEAMTVWQELADSAPVEERPRRYYLMGVSTHARGPKHYAEAVRYLRWVIDNDNQQGYDRLARDLLARINAQMMGDATCIVEGDGTSS